MARLEVDPAILDDAAGDLRDAADLAREFSQHRSHLTALAEDCGSHNLQTAIEHFVGRWDYGLGRLAGDADHLVGQLIRSADEYRRLEAEISRAAR